MRAFISIETITEMCARSYVRIQWKSNRTRYNCCDFWCKKWKITLVNRIETHDCVFNAFFFSLFKYPSLLLLIQSRCSNAVQSVLIDSIQKMIRYRIVTAQQRMKIRFACFFFFFVLRGKTAITTTTTTIIASMTTNQSDVFGVFFHEPGSLCVCVWLHSRLASKE